MTCREYAQRYYPDRVRPDALGGVVGCPYFIGLDNACLDKSLHSCWKCWDSYARIGGVSAKDEPQEPDPTWTALRDALLLEASKIAKATEYLDGDEISMVERLTKLAADIEDNRIFKFKRAEVIPK